MSKNVVLTINMDAKCAECRKPGATPTGICMKCAAKAMRPTARMKSEQGRAVQARYQSIFAKYALSVFRETTSR